MIKKLFNKENRKGFTLIELLLFMGIFSILIVALFQLMVAIFDVQLEAESTSSVSQDARFILNKFTYEIKKSSSITSPLSGSQSATLITSDGSTTYTFSLQNGNILLTNSALGVSDQLNSVNTSASGLFFSTLSDGKDKNVKTVSVSFTLKSKILRRSGNQTEDYKATIGIR